MLEFLARIGSESAPILWVPVLVWTGLAGAAAFTLKLARGLHPVTGYRLRQALLLALPASVLAAPWNCWSARTPRANSRCPRLRQACRRGPSH